MKPAWSVILLTTLIGAGQGLFLAAFAFGGAQEMILVAVLLTGMGLVASFFHLGRPERAWRAAAMWRTSWLSREVIVLPLFMALAFAFFLTGSPVAGWLAGKFMKGSGFGLVGNIVVGIVGALIGGFVFSLLGITAGGFLGSIVMATIGAVLLLYVVKLMKQV